MTAFIVIVGLTPAVLVGWGVFRLFRPGGTAMRNQLWRGLGWVGLWAAPMPFVQMFRWVVVRPSGYSMDLGEALVALPFSWVVLLGGRTVIAFFEANVRAITGHRQATMLDNWHVFLGLVLIQALVLSWVAARRLQRGATWRDGGLLAIGVLVALNAALAVSWPWPGS